MRARSRILLKKLERPPEGRRTSTGWSWTTGGTTTCRGTTAGGTGSGRGTGSGSIEVDPYQIRQRRLEAFRAGRPRGQVDDLAGAEQRLRDFLVGRFGGPQRYIEERGHPRLRMRHLPFPITPAAREDEPRKGESHQRKNQGWRRLANPIR
jgi:hypothetical protein